MKLDYQVVDVFTQTALEGNALAVFTNAEALAAHTMQKIAKELNLAETTFLLPASAGGCDLRVRIFTPVKEMMFAGHPTIGSAYVARAHGFVPRDATQFVLEEGVGPVAVRIEGTADPLIWLRTPPMRKGNRLDRAACAQAVDLGMSDLLPDAPCEIWSAGNPILFIAARDETAVDRAARRLYDRVRPGPLRGGRRTLYQRSRSEDGAAQRAVHSIARRPRQRRRRSRGLRYPDRPGDHDLGFLELAQWISTVRWSRRSREGISVYCTPTVAHLEVRFLCPPLPRRRRNLLSTWVWWRACSAFSASRTCCT
jgi:hypothetical protein